MKAIDKMRAQLAEQLLRDPGFAPAAVPWLRGWLVQFDLAKLDSIYVRREPGDWPDACWGNANPPPKRSRKQGWGLTCLLAPNYPNQVPYSLPPLYRQDDGTWAPAPSRVAIYGDLLPDWTDDTIDAYFLCLEVNDAAALTWAEENRTPAGVQIAGHGRPGGKRMIKVEGHEPIADVDESLVFIVAFMAHYWLRHTRQTPGIGGGRETAAGVFARGVLEQFRRERCP